MEVATDPCGWVVKLSINRKRGDNLKLTIAGWRAERRMTQIELAEAIGAKQAQISAWETGKKVPSVKNLYKLEKALKLKSTDRILLPND